MSTVLVLRFSSAGDVVLTAPAIDALKAAWPEARVVFATKRAFAELVRPNPQIDAVVALAPGESLAHYKRRLREHAPTAVLDLHGKARGLVLRRLAPRRAAWTQRPALTSLAVRLGLARYHADKTMARRYHEAVERLVGRALPPGRLRYFVSNEARERARAVLAAHGIDPTRPLVGMSPGAMWETKRWPLEHFAGLARALKERGIQVVASGSPAETALTRGLAEAAPGLVDLGSELSLPELGGLITCCTAFVANDSGPMHMARGLGVPTLALFGSTDPGQFDFTGHRALSLELACSPCSLYGRARCPEGHFRCLRELTAGQALQALEPLLDGVRRPWLEA